jgi:hypothetical protein
MPPDCDSLSCASHLKEDPALVCYRQVRATVKDGNGVAHHGSLYDQLGQALGIDRARIEPACTGATCNEKSYDCGGAFYDRDGKPIRVPDFPSGARSDADVKDWKAGVSDFYLGAYLDPRGNQLSPGKAALCTEWAAVSFQTRPDPSVLQAFDTLQQIGAEKAVGQDTPWMTHILDAGSAHGCPVPPVLPQHDEESWFLPESSARSFHRDFHNCEQPDPNRVGGCPHTFDGGSGNHVNAQFLLDATTMDGVPASVFVGDEPPTCGADCYRQTHKPRDETGQRSPAPRDRLVSTTRPTDADCTAAVNSCLNACESTNADVSRACINMGGSLVGGMCTANVDRCSCTQTAPDCRK